MATSAFLLPSPSYKEAGREKLFSLILFFLQIRGRPDKASARGGGGAQRSLQGATAPHEVAKGMPSTHGKPAGRAATAALTRVLAALPLERRCFSITSSGSPRCCQHRRPQRDVVSGSRGVVYMQDAAGQEPARPHTMEGQGFHTRSCPQNQSGTCQVRRQPVPSGTQKDSGANLHCLTTADSAEDVVFHLTYIWWELWGGKWIRGS